MTLRVTRNLFLAMMIVSLASPASKAGGQQTPKKTVSAVSAELSGGEIFNSYCSTCHGSDAKGKGPMAAVLKVPPPDLTTLSKRNNGKFPEDHIASVLKNGVDIPSHGTAEMPIWGSTFADTKTRRVVTMRVTDMLRYLESIQAK